MKIKPLAVYQRNPASLMNKIIFTLSIAVSAGLGYLAGKNNSSPDVGAYSSAAFEQKTIKISDAVKSPQKIHENNFHDVDTAEPDRERPHPNPEQLVAVDQSAQQQIDAIKAEYEFKQRSEEFMSWLTKNQEAKPWFDMGIEMRGRFDAEETDHHWAIAEEGRLQSLFVQEQALAGIALKSTACKSTQCQITVSVRDQDHANEMAMMISKVLGAENFSHVIIDSQVQQGETIFYMSRNEKGFELN